MKKQLVFSFICSIAVISLYGARDPKFRMINKTGTPISFALINLGESRSNLYLAVLKSEQDISSDDVNFGTLEVVLDSASYNPQDIKEIRGRKFDEKTSRVFKLKIAKENKSLLQKVGVKSLIPEKMHVEVYELRKAKDPKDNGLMLRPIDGVKGNITQSDIQWVTSEHNHSSDKALIEAAQMDSKKQSLDLAMRALTAGADINTQDEFGNTALMWAVGKGNVELVKILLNRKASVSKAEKQGRTPLMVAAHHGQNKIIGELLKAGADLEDQDDCQNTPLVFAVSEKHLESAKLLLDKGANVFHKARASNYPQEKRVFTVLDVALWANNLPMIELIAKYQRNVVGKPNQISGTGAVLSVAAQPELQQTAAMVEVKEKEGILTHKDVVALKKTLGIDAMPTGADAIAKARAQLRVVDAAQSKMKRELAAQGS